MDSIKIFPLLKAVNSEINIPGSKSYTNRALLLAALTDQKVEIINPLQSDDTTAMIECLKSLGIQFNINNNNIEVLNSIKDIKDGNYDLNANLSGTTIRFILALSTIIPGIQTISGEEGLNRRPIGDLVETLKQLGAKIKYLNDECYPAVQVLSSKLVPGVIKINGEISSQFLSAILMIAPMVGEVTIEVIGEQISKPYIDMTIDTMKKFGVQVINQDYQKHQIKSNQKYALSEYIVEGDFSSAGYFLAIAALTKSTLILKNLNSNSVQADKKFLSILEEMGNEIIYQDNQIKIIGHGIKPVTVNMADCPDQIQTLAVLAAFAEGVTKISGIQSLRVKETERVKALEQELQRMGIKTSSTKDTLVIYGGHPLSARIKTYGDHRMAMAFAVAGTRLTGMEIMDPEVVEKTFPEFWQKINSMGVKTELVKNNIVLIGMRGSGKTTVGKLLSKKLNMIYTEMDGMIVEKVGMSIAEIVAKNGWDYFRDQESEVAEKLGHNAGQVISTGGGIVIRPQNITALKQQGIFILLKASIQTLVNRIGDDPNRPALTDQKDKQAELAELLKQREKLYEDAADEIIETDNLTMEEVVNQILLKLKGEIK